MKRLYLSTTDKKVGGVCGGIADYLQVDSTIVRLVTVILALVTAILPLLIGYCVTWMIIPSRPAA